MLSIEKVAAKVDLLKQRHSARDQRMGDILSIRSGDPSRVAPGLFPEEFPKPLVANFIDSAARDTAEMMAPLPTFNCSSGTMVSDAARKFADKRTKIANYYVSHSRLAQRQVVFADRWNSYGQAVYYVEPDVDAQCPRIVVEASVGAYPEFNRWGETVAVAWRISKTLAELCAEYPEHEPALNRVHGRALHRSGDSRVELVRYCDAEQITFYVPGDKDIIVLSQVKNRLGECPAEVASRYALDEEARGAYDDIIWVQIARAMFAVLALEATEKTVQAPLALPSDVQEFAFGSDSVIRTNSPEKVRRVGVDVPQGAFVEMQNLEREMRIGSRTPEGRSGEIDASVITGQGVKALQAGFDTQIKTAQGQFQQSLERVIGLCFKLDEAYWPDLKKTIRGVHDGTPFEISYTPSKDINGDHTVDVSYGMMAGLDPNRALIFGLQAQAAGLVSRDLLRRNLPFPLDVTQEEQRIDVEKMREALHMSVAGLASAVPAMTAQGQDPAMIVRMLAESVTRRQKGESIEDILSELLSPPEPDPEEAAEPPLPEEVTGSESPLMGQQGPSIPMDGQGRPDMQQLLAGLSSSGAPQMGGQVVRQSPAA